MSEQEDRPPPEPPQPLSPLTPAKEGVPAGAMYIALATLRTGEVNLRWMRAQVFLFIHTPALAAIIPKVIESPFPKDWYILILVASGVGLLLGFIWLFAALRAEKWIDFWNRRINKLEIQGRAPIAVFTNDEFPGLDQGRASFHFLAEALPYLGIAAWIAVGAAAILRSQI